MSEAYISRRGDASANFGVKSYNTLEELNAATPKDNTIAIVTETEPSGWIFSDTQPTEVEEAAVWVQTSSSSAVKFNVMGGDNSFAVGVMKAMQYINGEWVDLDERIYRDGKWSEWCLFLYNEGDQCTAVTGGWEAQKDNSETTPATPVLTFNETTMKASIWHAGTSNFWGGVVRTKNGIDLTNYSKLVCKTVSTNGTQYLMVDEVDQTGFEVYTARATIDPTGTTTLDISGLTGLYDVMVYVYNNSGGTTSYAEISKIYLEV